MKENATIGVLGLGLMGRAMALRLQQSGFKVLGWSRSEQSLTKASGMDIDTLPVIHELLSRCDHLLVCLSDAAAISTVLLAPEAHDRLRGRCVVQTATIAPDESVALAQRLEEAGCRYLEAPVLGSQPEARDGTLIIMAAGDPALFTALLPLLQALGEAPRHIGAVGQAAALKLAMNQLIAALTAGFAYSLGLVRQHDIDVDSFMALLRQSALYAPTFDKKLARMLAGDFSAANFPLKHLLKDERLFAASLAGQHRALIEAMCVLLEDGVQQGDGDADYSALYRHVNPG